MLFKTMPLILMTMALFKLGNREKIMKLKNKKQIVLSIITIGFFSGCMGSSSYPLPTVQLPPEHVYNNMLSFNKNQDNYQLVLKKFGASLSQYARLKYSRYRDINIEVSDITNKTTDMEISNSSQGLLLNSLDFLTASNRNFFNTKNITISNNTFMAARNMEDSFDVPRVLEIVGSIDRSTVIYSKSRNFDGDATMTSDGKRADLGYGRESKDEVREISLSLRFVDRRKGNFSSYSRYAHGENSIRVTKKTDGSGFGVFLLGSGITGSGFKTYTPGVGQAIKILIEHTLIQAFGRNFEVPYWHSSPMYRVDEIQKSNMRDSWHSKNSNQKIKEVQIILNMYGFSIPIDSKTKKEKKLALKKTQLALDAIAKYVGIKGRVQSFDYYFNLYNNMPFGGFFPQNYNNLRVEIVNINSGKLPRYVEPPRPLPPQPDKSKRGSSTVIIYGGNMGVVTPYGGFERVQPIYDRDVNPSIPDDNRELDSLL